MPTSDEEAAQVLHELHRLADVYSIAEIDPDYWQKLCLLSVRERIEERKPRRRGRRKGVRPKAWQDIVVYLDFCDRMAAAKPGTDQTLIIDQMERDELYRFKPMEKGVGTIRRIIYRYHQHPEAISEAVKSSMWFFDMLVADGILDLDKIRRWCEEYDRLRAETLLGSKI